MYTEDFVSFELAKLLKEKGFDEECRTFWKEWDGEIMLCPCCSGHVFEFCCNSMLEGYNDDSELNVAAPTLQMAMKWLRNVHNIHFVVEPFTHDGNKIYYGVNVLDKDLVTVVYENLEDNTYEEACEAAIYYCIENLI